MTVFEKILPAILIFMDKQPKIDEIVDNKIEVAVSAGDSPIHKSEPANAATTGTPLNIEPFGVTTSTTTKRPLKEQNPLNTPENLASKTTAEEDLRTLGQRDLNLMWETTQMRIALFVVVLTMTISGIVVIHGIFFEVSESRLALAIAAFTFISSTTSLVVGFYFSRSNHARIGDDNKTTSGGLDDR